MKNKILKKCLWISFLYIGVNLSAQSQSMYPYEMDVFANDDTQLKVTCNYQKHNKYTKYLRPLDSDDFMELICENKNHGESLEISYSKLNEYV